ncbi:MAG: ATP-binding protein [Gammaproteobacteria bacterium]|jgi:signal transduction histidine kinase
MRLAGQLLLVSAVTLLLPWAGCQYAREVESALRTAETESVASSARLLAAALAPAAERFAAEPEPGGRNRDLDLYAHALSTIPTLDGFVEDWGAVTQHLEEHRGLRFVVGRRGAATHVFVAVTGARAPAALLLRGRGTTLRFPLDAPGLVLAQGSPELDARSRGYWQATSRGWQIEARVPAPLLAGRLGLKVLDGDGSARGTTWLDQPGRLAGPDDEAQAVLEQIAPPGPRVYLVDPAGFVLARQEPAVPAAAEAADGWLERVFRLALGTGSKADPAPAARPGQLSGRHIELAALGTPATRRYADESGAKLAAAAPVGSEALPAALVVVERDTAEILALTRAPTRRLLGLSLLASSGAAAALLGFAAWLSWRIRRLRDAAGAAVGHRGEVLAALPGAGAGDELGDLARQLDGLLGRVREHNLYLQELGGRLAHELRTPLAVVRSSLDNLEAEAGRPGPWLARAREGVDRMSHLVNALSAARQMERAIAAAELEDFDLAAQLEDMASAYRSLHPGHRFALARPPGPCRFHGAPELIAQALDKLVDNAVDFAPAGAEIRLALARRGDGWRLAVANPGSRLPPGPAMRLFDSLVSHRDDQGRPHLGLGLYIVRLVAERHGGRAGAASLPEEAGVEFFLELPDASPQRPGYSEAPRHTPERPS